MKRMEKECIICHEECVIPIIPKGFQCFKENQIHCFTKHRTCLSCYVTYYENTKECKCFYCKSPLENFDNFQIDVEYIMTFGEKETKCFSCNESMSHIDLFHHVFEKCFKKCQCGKYLTKKHEGKCRYFRNCVYCKKFHYMDEKSSYICRDTGIHCMDCGDVVTSSEHWTKQCLQRKVKCPECQEIFTAEKIVTHFSEHVVSQKTKVKNMECSLHNEEHNLLQMLNVLKGLYFDIFHETCI